MNKIFKIYFPISASSQCQVTLKDKEIKEFEKLKSEIEQKEYLFNKVSSPSACHYCSKFFEDPQIDDERLGSNLENVSFYDLEDEEEEME